MAPSSPEKREQIRRARVLASDPHFYAAQQYHHRSVARECGIDPVTKRGFDFSNLQLGPVITKILNGLKRTDNRNDKLWAVLPEFLGKHTRVDGVKNGTLYLRAAHPTVALELRGYLPAIKAAFKVAKVRLR